ncbi:hypothetical protein BDW75DRAFT_202332, partial [Aspergillus navahoensis]
MLTLCSIGSSIPPHTCYCTPYFFSFSFALFTTTAFLLSWMARRLQSANAVILTVPLSRFRAPSLGDTCRMQGGSRDSAYPTSWHPFFFFQPTRGRTLL